MPGTLYVVATPIGNLEDVTLRALRILREVSLIAAEDTRRTARLLQHYSISTRTTSLHEHNERAKTAVLIARLHGGRIDCARARMRARRSSRIRAARLVAAAHAAGIRVEPIPGPSAAIASLSASGFADQEFVVRWIPLHLGLKPENNGFERLAAEPRTLILYEAPHRIRA